MCDELRESLINLLSDCTIEEDVDGDVTESGRIIDQTTYVIALDHFIFDQLVDMLLPDIPLMQSRYDALQQAFERLRKEVAP